MHEFAFMYTILLKYGIHKKIKKLFSVSVLFFFIVLVNVSSQTSIVFEDIHVNGLSNTIIENSDYDNSILIESNPQQFVIYGETFNILGRTRVDVLSLILGNPTGIVFYSEEELLLFVKKRVQKLEDLRSFQSSVINITFEEAIKDNTVVPVFLEVEIKDNFFILPIPYALYDSNKGFMAGLNLMLPNVAGSLQDIVIMGLYNAYPDVDNVLQWTNPIFQLSVDWSKLRIGSFMFAVKGTMLKYNELVTDRGDTVLVSNSLLVGSMANMVYQITDNFSNTFSLIVNGNPQVNVTNITNSFYYSYAPLKIYFQVDNTVELNKIDWNGNFRHGIKTSGTVSALFFFPYYEKNWSQFRIKADFSGHYMLTRFFNPSFKITAMYANNNAVLTMGDNIRGIINNELKGNIGFYINTGFQIKLFKIFKTEFHLNPLLDFALVYATDGTPNPLETGFGIGAELLVFNESIKTFPIKLGIAFDLRPKYGNDISKRIEVDFNFVLTY